VARETTYKGISKKTFGEKEFRTIVEAAKTEAGQKKEKQKNYSGNIFFLEAAEKIKEKGILLSHKSDLRFTTKSSGKFKLKAI
jgi:hypothetical protein